MEPSWPSAVSFQRCFPICMRRAISASMRHAILPARSGEAMLQGCLGLKHNISRETLSMIRKAIPSDAAGIEKIYEEHKVGDQIAHKDHLYLELLL